VACGVRGAARHGTRTRRLLHQPHLPHPAASPAGCPPNSTTLACLQVTSLGGGQPWPWQATPEFQISAWGGTKAEANLLARTAVAAAYDLVGTAVDGGRVVGVDVRLAPLWLPDEDTNRPRYRTDVALTCMP
jgi:hypothetical protein